MVIIRGNAREPPINEDLSDIRTDVAAIMGIGLYLIMITIFLRFRKLSSPVK
ncbi:MAG: hypothetical protein IH840_18590 [Candidatus Heimdallarchaeota archaeon]|nr:hypothetical protein [Candidatus Heimdallarchaeota archaeon]